MLLELANHGAQYRRDTCPTCHADTRSGNAYRIYYEIRKEADSIREDNIKPNLHTYSISL